MLLYKLVSGNVIHQLLRKDVISIWHSAIKDSRQSCIHQMDSIHKTLETMPDRLLCVIHTNQHY